MTRRLRLLLSCAMSIVLSWHIAFAQDEDRGPLAGSEAIRQSAEMIMIFTDTTSALNDGPSSYQKIYDYLDIDNVPIDQKLTTNDLQSESDSMGVFGSKNMYVATGNFNDDEFDDIVAAWSGPDTTINIIIPDIDADNLNWQNASRLVINGGTGRIYLKTGDFDADGLDEFMIAYDADSTIHIEIYDTDGGLTPRFVDGINDEPLSGAPNFRNYSVELGDLDGDDNEEIVLAAIEPTVDGTWAIYGKIYDVSSSGTITASTRNRIYEFLECNTCQAFDYLFIDVAVSTGRFDDFYDDEIIFAFNLQVQEDNSPQVITDSSFLMVARSNDELSDIEVNDMGGIKIERFIRSLTISVGDLDNNGTDEIVNGRAGFVEVYESDSAMNLSLLTSENIFQEYDVGSNPAYTYQYLDIGDVDADGHLEIVIVDNYWRPGIDANDPQRFNLYLYELNDSLQTLELKAELLGDEVTVGRGDISQRRHFAIAFGDFDGDRLRFGKPARYTDTDIHQPLVILNAPPVHFDIIDNTVYDINTCFNGANCDFYATYEKQEVTTIEVTTEVNQAWSTDSSEAFELGGELGNEGGSIGGKINQKITNTYGEDFTGSRRKAETIKIRVKATALNEDQIYATVTDYDTWEYPVYRSDEFIGYIVVVVPTVTQHRWFPSKSWTGLKYVPNHEVGNILSYLEYNDLSDNEYLADRIKLDKGDGFTLGPSSNYNWSLEFSEFAEYEAKEEIEIGLQVGRENETTTKAGLELFAGIKAKVSQKASGSYNSSESEKQISTHRTRIGQDLTLAVQLGSIFSTGDEYYTVTPYAYWGESGAMVLDYTAAPVLAPPGYPETWWQTMYGKEPDPGFLLPWNYDVEKGLSINDDRKKYLSNEILLQPNEPAIGDTVTTSVRIHNFSLLPLDDSVSVRLFLGDPDAGGTPITGVNGETQMLTPEFMASRDRAVVQMKWIVPGDVKRYARVYAVIDQENNVAEIHEDNNKAFAIMGNTEGGTTTSVDDSPLALLPEGFVLHQNYPNPFNADTKIEYSIGTNAETNLSVFNILGQRVATLVTGIQPSGSYEILWDGKRADGTRVGSGIYFYLLQVEDSFASKSMILLK